MNTPPIVNTPPLSAEEPCQHPHIQQMRSSTLPNRAERWLQALQFLSPAALMLEPELVTTRWPSYRDLDPMAANIKFGQAFQAAFRWQFKKQIDLREAEKVQGIDLRRLIYPRDGRMRAELTAVNKARQAADRHRLPYKPFIDYCIKFASDRGVHHIARPNQLIPSSGKRLDFWNKKLEQFQSDFADGMTSEFRAELQKPLPETPGCFGIPGASGKASICLSCPTAGSCAFISNRVLQKAAEKGWADYADKEEALRVKRNLEKKQRQRDVRSGVVQPVRRMSRSELNTSIVTP